MLIWLFLHACLLSIDDFDMADVVSFNTKYFFPTLGVYKVKLVHDESQL